MQTRQSQRSACLWLISLLVTVHLTNPRSIGAQPSARPSRPLRVAYLSTSATMASLWMAKEIGGFAKEGLDVEVISMSSSNAIPALIANELDAVQVSAAPVITASLRGIDVVFIAGILNTMIWDFYVRPEIKSVEQLKGKIVGTDRPATPVRYGTMVALKKLGLTPKDVQLFPLGSSPQIVAALRRANRRRRRLAAREFSNGARRFSLDGQPARRPLSKRRYRRQAQPHG